MSEAELPVTVQIAGVVDEKLTVRPELAVADKFSVAPMFCAAMAANVMVWGSRLTAKIRIKFGAAAKCALPGCEASMMQFPGAIIEAVLPETVQTACVPDMKLTGSPELADADRFTVAPTFCAAMAAKLMV
jgi:hypothetical protein